MCRDDTVDIPKYPRNTTHLNRSIGFRAFGRWCDASCVVMVDVKFKGSRDGKHQGRDDDLLHISPTRLTLSVLRCGLMGLPSVSICCTPKLLVSPTLAGAIYRRYRERKCHQCGSGDKPLWRGQGVLTTISTPPNLVIASSNKETWSSQLVTSHHFQHAFPPGGNLFIASMMS